MNAELHHLGYAVRDLDEAMAMFTELFGTAWLPVTSGRQEFRTRGGRVACELAVVKSVPGAGPQLELLQGGSVWATTARAVLHHRAVAVERIEQPPGWDIEITSPAEPASFAYLTKRDCLRTEVLVAPPGPTSGR